jgi:hypothetical protein
MTTLVQQQMTEADRQQLRNLLRQVETSHPLGEIRRLALSELHAFMTPGTVLNLLDEVERLERLVQEERHMRAKVARIANYLNEFASGRSSFSRIQEINDAIQEVPDGH